MAEEAAIYKSIVDNSTMKKFKIKMFKDTNTFKDNPDSQGRKEYTSYPIHKLIFMKMIGGKCDGKFPAFSISSH